MSPGHVWWSVVVSLLEHREQALLPDAVWRVRAHESGTVGLVFDVTTRSFGAGDPINPLVTYSDTLTERVMIEGLVEESSSMERDGASEESLDEVFGKQEGGDAWLTGGLILVFMTLLVIFGIALSRKRPPKTP